MPRIQIEFPPNPESYEQKARAAIFKGFQAMKEELAHLEQTTHGHFTNTMGDLIWDLVVAYQNPTAYTVSNLAQAIDYICTGKDK
jgi:hypothetical protein